MQELNSDPALYRPLDDLYGEHEFARRTRGDNVGFLCDEDVAMVKSLKHDFERGGITLSVVERRRLTELQESAGALGAAFVSPSSEHAAPVLELPISKLKCLPADIRNSFQPSAMSGYAGVHVDGSTSQALLKWTADARIREKVYRLMHGYNASSRLNVLDSLLETRHEIATRLGHDSYAELLFDDRLASSPEDVMTFLEQFSRIVKDSGHKERNIIEMEKLRREPHISSTGSTTVHGWDRSFYIGRLKAQDFNISSTEVSNYLPLSACLLGLADIVEHLFGLKMHRINADEGELWHDSVQKVQITEQSGEVLGHIFLDLHPREGKYEHAAHFSVRCGRQPAEQTTYQTPIVALVCNFGQNTEDEKRLLTISEYETLFHEFGHSLHSLLSRTKYQHLSGTRVATDFVEVPSHLFEHFAWDARVVSRFARHHRTGDPIPTTLLRSLCASRKGFAGTDVQMQILFSAMDLQFHGRDPPVGRTTEAFEDLQSRLTSYPPDVGVSVPSSFHHLVGYGAGYYSYIFARVLSSHLWSSLFEEAPLSRAGGEVLRQGLLSQGAARNPSSLLSDVLDSPSSCAPFLRALGLDTRDGQVKLQLPIIRS